MPVERERISADELTRLQRGLVGSIAGDVFEIGAGTGANLAALGAGARWQGGEPDRRRRERLRAATRMPVTDARAEALPLADASLDALLATFVFCSVDDVDAALAEARRTLRPGGRLVFVEHVAAAPGTVVRRLQRAVTPLTSRVAHNCHYDRDPVAAAVRHGFSPVRLERCTVPSGIPGLRVPVDVFDGIRDDDRQGVFGVRRTTE